MESGGCNREVTKSGYAYTARARKPVIAERGQFSRICVEVDLRKQLTPKVTVREHVLPVQYERLHMICFGCGKFRHRKEACLGLDHDQMEANNFEQSKTMVVQEVTLLKQLVVDGKVVAREDDFGGWMIPQHQLQRNRIQSRRNLRENACFNHETKGNGSRFDILNGENEEIENHDMQGDMTNEEERIEKVTYVDE